MSSRLAAAPLGAFASLLDQLGQPLTASIATVSPTSDGSGANAMAPGTPLQSQAPAAPPALANALPPAAPLQTASPPEIAAPLPTAGPLAAPTAQPPGACTTTGLKTAAKKSSPDMATEPDPLPLTADSAPPALAASVAVPAPLSFPVAIQPVSTAGSLIEPPLDVAAAPTIRADVPGSAPVTPTETPSLPAPPALPSTSPQTEPLAASSSPAEVPTPSRMAGQAAAATQAGLSVDDDRRESVMASEAPETPQARKTALDVADLPPSAAPITLASLPTNTPLTTTPAAAPLTPTQMPAITRPSRGTGPASVRNGAADAPDAQLQPPGSSSNVAAGAPPSATVALEVQPLTPAQLPAVAALATAATVSTRAAQGAAPPPPSPAAQVAQVITEPVKVVLTSPVQAGSTAPHVTTIQITPVELGRVDVRIERTSDGSAKIQLVAERPETLSRLIHDQSHLQQALDHAGIPQNSRTIEFSLAPTTPTVDAFTSGLFGNSTSQGEQSGSGFQRQNTPYSQQNFDDPTNVVPSSTQSRVGRTGIDITA